MTAFGSDMPGGPFDDRGYLAEYGSGRADRFFDLVVAASPRDFADVLRVVALRPIPLIREDVVYVVTRIVTAPGYAERVETALGPLVDRVITLAERAGHTGDPARTTAGSDETITLLDIAVLAAGVVAFGEEIIERRQGRDR